MYVHGPAGTTFETGVQEGDGQVSITFDAEDGGCPDGPTTSTAGDTTTTASTGAAAATPRYTG